MTREKDLLRRGYANALAQLDQKGTDHGLAQTATVTEQVTASSALLDGRIWLQRTPWRMAGGWSMLAALLALGFTSQPDLISLPFLVLLFLLVDLLWGSIWGAITLPDSLPNIERSLRQSRIWLPYLQPGSPAARLFGLDAPGILPILARVALPGIAVALLVAATLDTMVFWLTGVVVLLSIAGWLHRQVPLVPVVFLYSLVTVTLPWWATLEYVGLPANNQWQTLAFVGLWTLHAWGGNHNLSQASHHWGLVAIAIAQIGITILLILAQAPLWLAIIAILWLPTWLALYSGQPLRRVEIWWLLAMLISALALGQSILV